MTAPTQPHFPTSAAIPKDGEYAGSFAVDTPEPCDVYDCGGGRDRAIHGNGEDDWLPAGICSAPILAQHRLRKAKLAESPTMTRDEIIETAAKAGYETANPTYQWKHLGDDEETRAHWRLIAEAQLIAVGKIGPLKPAPVKTPEHTPTPWEYQEASDAYTHIIRGPGNYFIVQFSQHPGPSIAEANARHIVKCVNEHAALAAQAAADAQQHQVELEQLRERCAGQAVKALGIVGIPVADAVRTIIRQVPLTTSAAREDAADRAHAKGTR